jgi:hypothetical protein
MPTVAEVVLSVIFLIFMLTFFILKETYPLLAIWLLTFLASIILFYKVFIGSPDEYYVKTDPANDKIIFTISVVAFVMMSSLVFITNPFALRDSQTILRQGRAPQANLAQDLFNVPRQDIYGDPDFQNVITFDTIPDGTEVVHITSRPGNNPNDSIYPVPEEEHLRRAFFQNLAKRNIRTRTPFTRDHVRRGPYRHRSSPKKTK